MSEMKLAAFYRDEIPTDEGYKINEILTWGPDQWEATHSTIQWVFPTKEPSMFNPDAPIFTDDEIKLFNEDPVIKENYAKMVMKMLDVYGFDLMLEGEVMTIQFQDPIHSVHEDPQWWFRSFNHNYLRMTRILTSLRYTGYDTLCNAMYQYLSQYPERLDQETRFYWTDAALGTLS